MSSAIVIVGGTLAAVGTLISVLAALGVLDFPSTLARMHAATKSASLGLALITLGAGLAARSWDLAGIGVLVAGFLFVTAPVSGHMLGRAAYLAGQAEALVHDDLAGQETKPGAIARPPRRDFSVVRWAVMVGIWMLLWRDVSLGTLLGGGFVASLIELGRRSASEHRPVRLTGVVPFFLGYAGLVIRSNARVAWEVLTPSNEAIREAIVAVPLQVNGMAPALLVANAVSFTPGTLSIELSDDPLVLYVHVLHFDTVESVVNDVRQVESLVEKVVPPSRESLRP